MNAITFATHTHPRSPPATSPPRPPPRRHTDPQPRRPRGRLQPVACPRRGEPDRQRRDAVRRQLCPPPPPTATALRALITDAVAAATTARPRPLPTCASAATPRGLAREHGARVTAWMLWPRLDARYRL